VGIDRRPNAVLEPFAVVFVRPAQDLAAHARVPEPLEVAGDPSSATARSGSPSKNAAIALATLTSL
jgi:hypothetical protein